MAQHFLLSSAARKLSLAKINRMGDREAETLFASIRWTETNGAPVCPHCGSLEIYTDRRKGGSLRFRCKQKECASSFSLTSGTLFAFHKLPLRTYLAAIAIYCNEVKGKSALALSRDLDVQYKTAFVLSHKIREAVASEMKGRIVGGEGKIAEVDGGYFGGYVKPANYAENRRDRRLAINQNGKRKVVVVVRERDGRSITQTFPTEAASTAFVKARVAKGTELMADEAGSWNALHTAFAMKRIDHGYAYSDEGACTNGAEEFFSRLRRAEVGHHHHIAGVYLARYASEAAWRDDHRRMSNGEQFRAIASLVTKNKPSVDFCGYWQRHIAA
ncbi:MAG: IS1595 family transposase [Bradyrhizobium sp.]|nr:MAG: IS1595 family transposase [Bradyrhizobium sp.]